ncbi:MAG: DNA polymerase III subunit gamma/tau [Candidatus Omnitrophota bacterium]|nr:MAG: DNA polymerase III subunit gamma/tau [Candidatus Omnitrophota bacterium]
MSYLAFALKYRPQNFDEVVGQRHVVAALKNAILKNRVHHAYLFSGQRGVGKTSLARILAKSLNCFEGPTVFACGKCASCLEISRGTSLDIIEIDGASNRGIDEIRTLRENVKLAPAHSRYKIYIIDEVHMLTQEAFNALLKTLEEPPAHVKFVFATTHPQKVLPTILSRCQRFQFNLISLEEIVSKLKIIAASESIEVESRLFYEIARAAGGSVRDAESLFDQIVPVILEKGAVGEVLSFLGVIDEDTLNIMLKCLVEKDLAQSLDFIDKLLKEGKDLGVFVSALLEHLRNFLLAKVSIRSFNSLMDISPQSKEVLLKLSKNITVSQIINIIDSLIAAKDLSRKLNTVRIPLELAIVKVTYDYEQEPPVSAPSNSVQVNQEPALEKDAFRLDIDSLEEAPLEEAFNIDEEAKPSVDDGILCQAIKPRWGDVIANMQKVRAAIASHLSFAKPVSSQGSLLKVAFSKKDYFHKEIVEEIGKTKVIEEIVSKFIGKPVRVKFIFQEEMAVRQQPVEEEAEKVTEAASKQAGDDEFINDLLDSFGGRISTEND